MSLRPIAYTYIQGVASPDGQCTFPKQGNLATLLWDADGLLFYRAQFPPLRILNALLAIGKIDRGMSGGAAWEPFEVSEAEFEELLAYVATPEGRKVFYNDEAPVVLDVPDSVRTISDFHEWKIDEALKDPNHHLNGPERNCVLADGRRVTFREYWELEKMARRSQRSE